MPDPTTPDCFPGEATNNDPDLFCEECGARGGGECLRGATFHLWTNQEEWWVATGREELIDLMCEMVGKEEATEDVESYEKMDLWTVVHMSWPGKPTAGGFPEGATVTLEGSGSWSTLTTAEEWIEWAKTKTGADRMIMSIHY